MTLRKNNLVTAASPSAVSRGTRSSLANSLSFSVSPKCRGGRSASLSPPTTEHASEENTSSTSSRIRSLEQRAESVRQNMNAVERQRDQALAELAAVKKELGKVLAELKGFYARETTRMEDMRVLKESNRKLQEEVKRLDGVALDLENELSAAEIKLERYESGEFENAKAQEKNRALESKLRETEMDLEAREWRIDDLMHQVSVLRECVVEYQGKIIDAERASASLAQALQETEASYYTVVQSSMDSLQSMDARLNELKEAVVSKQGSNGSDGGLRRRPERNPVTTPESMGYSANIEVATGSATVQSLESRLSEMERVYESTLKLCDNLKQENAYLKEEMDNVHSRNDEESKKAKEETRIELTSALARIEDEATAKVEEELKKLRLEHDAEMKSVQLRHQGEISMAEKVKDGEIAHLKEETKALGLALESSKSAEASIRAQNKMLSKEKEALCGVIEDLKRALERQGAGREGVNINNHNKENNIVNEKARMSINAGKAGNQMLTKSIRGTPLRSLGNVQINK